MAALLDPTLIAQIRGIAIRAKYLVTDVFAGEYQSAFKGRGLEFEEIREYQPGDDIRAIDWNVTARAGHPFIKLHRDERELTVMFLVDVSASSHFGTVSKFKNEMAAEITALLAYAALKNNDKVGLLIFSDQVDHYLPPKKGRGHVWQLIRDILTFRPSARKTDFDIPLDFLNRVLRKKAIVFLVSDFQTKGFEQNLRITAKHHDLIAISIADPKEQALPKIGFLELEDAETGETVLIDTHRESNRTGFSKAAQQHVRQTQKLFLQSGIDHIKVQTDSPYLDAILTFFRQREKRR